MSARKRVGKAKTSSSAGSARTRRPPAVKTPREPVDPRRREYRLLIAKRVEKQIEALPIEIRRLVVERVLRLASEPRPPGCESLAGRSGAYRVRQGSYRVVYEVNEEERAVIIANIGHRRDVYR